MSARDPVDAWLAEGRAAYPEVELAPAAFRAAVARHGAAGEGADGVHGPDLYLATACALGDAAAVRRFEADHLARIPGWLKLAAADHELVAEVRQRVATRALVGHAGEAPRIAQYQGRGPLWAWVRIIALREHARLRRELGRPGAAVHGDDDLDELARSGDLPADLVALRARYAPAMMAAFRVAIAALTARDRTLLRLAYVDAVSLDAIGRMYGVNKSTVSRWLATIRGELLAQAGDRLRRELGVAPDELASLLGLMPRDLDVSLHGLLAPAGA